MFNIHQVSLILFHDCQKNPGGSTSTQMENIPNNEMANEVPSDLSGAHKGQVWLVIGLLLNDALLCFHLTTLLLYLIRKGNSIEGVRAEQSWRKKQKGQ